MEKKIEDTKLKRKEKKEFLSFVPCNLVTLKWKIEWEELGSLVPEGSPQKPQMVFLQQRLDFVAWLDFLLFIFSIQFKGSCRVIRALGNSLLGYSVGNCFMGVYGFSSHMFLCSQLIFMLDIIKIFSFWKKKLIIFRVMQILVGIIVIFLYDIVIILNGILIFHFHIFF